MVLTYGANSLLGYTMIQASRVIRLISPMAPQFVVFSRSFVSSLETSASMKEKGAVPNIS
jgi:hypothetical protein